MEPTQNKNDIIRYYVDTHEDYEIVWELNKAHGLHFGYKDSKTQSFTDTVLNMNRIVAERAGIKEGSKVLDCGCGIGGTAVWIAKKYKARVTGISITPHQIEEANKLADKYGVTQLTNFIVGDFNEPGLNPESYDASYFIESLGHSFDRLHSLKQIFKLLKRNTKIVITDYFLGKEKEQLKDHRIAKLFEKGWAMAPLATIEYIQECLQKIGFEDIVIENAKDKVLNSSQRLSRMAMLSLPFELWGKLIGKRKPYHWYNTIHSIYQYSGLKRDVWRYGIISAQKP